MKNLLFILMLSITFNSCHTQEDFQREIDFNAGWQFFLQEDSAKNNIDLNSVEWRNVNLPHDWSVEFPFDSINGEGCTGYLPGGIGWYKKQFKTNTTKNDKVFVWFDGVYNNSEYWINGQKLGIHPYGYSPFYFDLTNHLNENGEPNQLVVKVDRSRYADSRWYTGSGIYRNVKLVKVNKLHIPIWGTFIKTSSVSKNSATIEIETTVNNTNNDHQTCDLITQIINAKGEVVASQTEKGFFSKIGATVIKQHIKIESPKLWDIKKTNLYKARTSIICNNKQIDQYITSFGIRSIKFDKDEGFFLNGENLKIKGVCLHHDAGLVGTAVPKGVWKRRLQILKDGGCNAIRVSHNPASVEFLELCDEMGFLVQDEFFDEWDYPKDKRLNKKDEHDDYKTRGYTEHFQEWGKADLTNTMLAHRNHPSIIQWSIGNEIEWTYPRNSKATGFFDNMHWSGNYFWTPPPYSPERIKEEYNKLPAGKYEIGKTAKKLSKWTKELDTTRPVVANCILPSASFESGYADVLDIVGYSYRRVMYDYAKEHYPDKIVMGTENLPQWHEWKAIEERPHISGTFLWTGYDYMGESNAQWPRKATPSGLLDLIGYPKPSYHMYKTLWSDELHIYMCSNAADQSQYQTDKNGKLVEKTPEAWKNALWFWYDVNEHWNYKEKENIIVEVISNCPQVELFLNGKSLGTKELSEFLDRIYKWEVPFQQGELLAKGIDGSKQIKTTLKTCDKPNSIKVEVDKSKLKADGYDVAHLMLQLTDRNGVPVKNAERVLNINIEGAITSLGVDNGSARSVQKFQANTIKTHEGKAMVIIQALNVKGKGVVTISSEGLDTVSVELQVIPITL